MARFDKEAFADLLHKARGDRSINQYGLHAGVDPGYISRLVRAIPDTAPGPGIIRRLAAKAYGGVKFEDLMIAAGHIDAPVSTRLKETPLDQRVENDGELSLEGFLARHGFSEEDIRAFKALEEGIRARNPQNFKVTRPLKRPTNK